MRVISKFHDYYDSAMGQGQDRSLVFVRHHQAWNGRDEPAPPAFVRLVELSRLRPHSINRRQPKAGVSELSVDYGLVWFAGRVYPFAKVVVKADSLHSGVARFAHAAADLATLLAELGCEIDLKAVSKRHLFRDRDGQVSVEAFFSQNAEVLMPLAYEHHIAVASCFHGDVQLNPRLADLQFVRKLGPWEAFQELSMFWGNVAAPDRVPVTVSDKDRVQQHGFDEWSFRKLPQKA